MGFDKGRMKFSVVGLPEAQGEGFEAGLLRESYKDSRPSIGSPVIDTTSGASLSTPSRKGVPEDFIEDGRTFFCVRTRDLKIDRREFKERLQMRIREEELKNGGTRLSKKQRKEIQEIVMLSMEETAKVETKGTRCVLSPNRNTLLVEATTTKALDDTMIGLTSCVALTPPGVPTKALSPGLLYEAYSGKRESMYIPVDLGGMKSSSGIGRDFLTWLFMASESQKVLPDGVTFAVTGSLVMEDCRECKTGAVNISLKKGEPASGKEVVACLEQGKKVCSIEGGWDFEGMTIFCAIDEELHIKGLKIGDKSVYGLDARVTHALLFVEGLKKVFRSFVGMEEHNAELMGEWLKRKRSIVGP